MNGRFNPNDFPTIESKRLRTANKMLQDTNERYWKLLQDQRKEIIELKLRIEEMKANAKQ